MHEYEIRVLQSDGRSTLITSELHLDDHSAIRSARKLANGKGVEVWRGIECIYGCAPALPSAARPPDHSAA